jgi:glycosyltransferase involved in cell wall biosynthesis
VKVLHVSSGNLYGGIETMLVTMARHRHECPQMEQRFALCFDGRVSAELRPTGAPVNVLGAVRLSRPLSVWRARRALRVLLDRSDCDVVICHGPWPLAVFGPAVRSARIPLVMWAHGPHTGRHWLERWARLRLPDLVISNSRFTTRQVSRFMPTVAQTVILYPVTMTTARVEPQHRDALRRELDTPSDAVVVVLASRMEAWKGHRTLLAALALLRENPNWYCWILGGAQRKAEARYLNGLQLLASSSRIAGRLQFLGDRTDVLRVLPAADIHCQPNTGPEPFGIAFIEAMSVSLPVVTSALGAAPEIIDETCGRLVPRDDPTSLAHVIDELIMDRALRRRLGAAGPARARMLCDPHDRLTDLEATLRTLVRGPRVANDSTLPVMPIGTADQ